MSGFWKHGGVALALTLAWTAAPARAQVPSQQGLIERILPATPPSLGPSPTPAEPRAATGPGASQPVPVARVELFGNEALPTAALQQHLAGIAGQTVPLSRLEEARLAVLRAYRLAGFPYVTVNAALAAAAEGLTYRLVVVEGYVAAVRLDGDIGPAGTQVLRFLEPVLEERPISQPTLERALLLATDIPGVIANGVLRAQPGGQPGALELVVRLQRRKASGFVNLDNRGADTTGAWQVLAVGGLNAMTSMGERTEVSVVHAEGNRQNYVQLSEELFLGRSGLRMRGYFGAGEVRPGGPLSALGYLGETRVGGLAASYPVIRSRPLNVNVGAQLDMFSGTVSLQPGHSGPRVRQGLDEVRALRVSADASVRDGLLRPSAGAATTFGVMRVSQGLPLFGASDSAGLHVQRLGSEFSFTKLSGEITRLQPLLRPFANYVLSVQLTLAGQYSGNILPPSEKFYLGGTRLGRGFYSGQVAGDSAVVGSIEVQLSTGYELHLPRLAMQAGQLGSPWVDGLLAKGEPALGLQFYGFHDQGQAYENKPGDVNRRVSSWGGGVRAILSERVQMDLEGVQRLTRTPDGSSARPLAGEAVYFRLLTRF